MPPSLLPIRVMHSRFQAMAAVQVENKKKEAKSAICQSHATIGALYGLFAVRETQKQVTIKGISYARYAQERLR